MSARPYKPANIPGMMPYIYVEDPKQSIDYFEKTFGFQVEGKPMVQNDKIQHVELSFLDTRIMLAPEGAWGSQAKTPKHLDSPASLGLYVYCKDVDVLYEKAKAAGANITSPPELAFWGDKMFRVTDLDGYSWTFAQNVEDFDPSKIPS